MKFSKTYLQTMTDPSFPKEWREKGLEYKELKKLINGVVAELESLGLSADVLKDLLEPPEQEQEQSSSQPMQSTTSTDSAEHSSEHGDEISADLMAGMARLSTAHPPPTSDFIDPLSPLMEDEEYHRRSREQAMVIPSMPTMPQPLIGSEASGESPAGEWLATVAHHRHHHGNRHGTRSRSRSRTRTSESPVDSDTPSSSGGAATAAAAALPLGGGATGLAPPPSSVDTEHLRASPMSMLGIRRDIAEPHASESAENDFQHSVSPTNGWKMGRKDLEEMRKSSSTARNPSQKGKRKASSTTPEAESSERHDWGGHAWRERQGLGWDAEQQKKAVGGPGARALNGHHAAASSSARSNPQARERWIQGKDGRRARAEYELAGTPEHPIPRIKLIIESPVNSDDSGSESEEDSGEADGILGKFEHEDDESRFTELPPSLPGSRRQSLQMPVPPQTQDSQEATNGSGTQREDGELHSNGADVPRRTRTREILIPLTADTEFLDTLTASLAKLSELQTTQKETFVTSTEDLCASVARAASPYASKNDLYVWREIFSLWVDMQIFESQREKDRGELSVDESETRLKRFAEELMKRGWLADNPLVTPGKGAALSRNKKAMEKALSVPMKDSRNVSAVEDFLRLNLALLDLKKFQRVNVEAARKILKKHDKRTALTASSGLREFVAASQAQLARQGVVGLDFMSGSPRLSPESTGTLVAPSLGSTHPSLAALLPSATTGLLSESLPHILLSLLTSTLLPILPSVDDYSCSICTGLAWRPIRLDCSHLFCIRCLVKLQKAGKDNCPLCRALGVVKTADGRNIDEATANMLRLWFPREIEEKGQENNRDRKKEELAELGLEEKKCVVM